MRPLSQNSQAIAAGGRERFFALLACPRCAGPVVVEHNPSNEAAVVEVDSYPESGPGAAHVEDLPDDVADYYGAAIRVLGAGAPDSAAVELRKPSRRPRHTRGLPADR